MNQEQVEQWIAQQGGAGRVQHSTTTKQVDNPAADPLTAKAAGVAFSPTAPEKITVQEQKWTAVDAAGKPTGAVLHVSGGQGGSYDVVAQSGANPATASDQKAPPGGNPFKDDDETKGQTGRRWGWNPETGAYDRDLGPSPAAQGIGVKPGQDEAMGSETSTDAQGKTVKVTTYKRPDGTTYTKTESVQAAPEKPQVATGTLNTTSPQYAVVNPDGSVTWRPNPNYQNPAPKPIDLPNTRTISWANPDGTITTQKNPNYVKKSVIKEHPSDPTKLINITEDDNGNTVVLPVDDKTVIKPADLPVLQAKYGQIAQGLGALAQDLNSRFARGEITEKQKNDAFTAAHQQAQTQVAEINQILDTSKTIWSGELTQRGQSLSETQSRRGFAQNIFDRSMATGLAVGESAGPGHGKAIAAGVGAMLRMGQRYAEGMGGFRESPEVPLPAALQQARGIGIPGYEGATPGAGVPPAYPPGSQSGPPGVPQGVPPGAGISDTTDAGGVPRVMTPGSATGGMPVPQAMAPGQDPRLAAMQQQLMGADGFGGSPVAAGGLGVYDPTQDVQGMVGDGADPTWAEAVRRAAGEVSQPGYAWQRFGQPSSRFG